MNESCFLRNGSFEKSPSVSVKNKGLQNFKKDQQGKRIIRFEQVYLIIV